MRFHVAAAIALASSAALAADDISADLARILAAHDGVPALAAAAVLDGRVVAEGAAGVRKVGAPAKVTIDDRFHLGSCTKSMTATLAAIMVREGDITWTTTIPEVLDDLDLHGAYRAVTLEQLLSNTAGLPKKIPEPLRTAVFARQGPPVAQRRRHAAGILAIPPRYDPGKGYEYSNSGFAVAGAMLEAAAGRPWEDLMQARLFAPLGMKSAGFLAPGENGKVLQPYGHRGHPPQPVPPVPRGDNPAAISPAGGVHCTIRDWAKYAALHLGHGPDGMLNAEERAILHKPRNDQSPYALGWVVTRRPWAGGPCLTHSGSNTLWFSVIWIAPEKDFAAVAVTNTGAREGFAAADAAVARFIGQFLEKSE